MLSIVIYGATLLFITFLVCRRRSSSSEAVDLPPGSKGLPFVGETLQLLAPTKSFDLPPFFKSRFRRYGPVFQTRLIGRSVVVSMDPNLNRLLAQQEGTLVEAWLLDTFSKVFSLEGEGRISAVGDVHKYLRSITLRHFGTRSLKDKLLNQIQDLVNDMLHNWSSRESIEVKQSVLDMSTDFAANLTFGYDGEKSPKNLGRKFDFISKSFSSFPINIPGTSFYKSLKYKEEIMNTIRFALKERLGSPKSRREDLMDHALEDSNTMGFVTDEFIVSIVFLLVYATSDTTSTLVTLVLKFLSENPSVLDELMVEHETFLKNRANPGSQLTWNEVRSMTFTLDVINESLRLGNVAIGLFRKALKDIKFNGYTIPAGWVIMMVTSACHFDPDIFPDPLTFNPSRWKDLTPDVVSKNFMPFGGGTRQCAGAEFEKAFMVVLVHVLVTKYKWTKIKGGEISRTIGLNFKSGLHIKVDKKEQY